MSKNVKIIQCQFCGSGSKFNFYIRKKRKEGFVGRFTYRAAFIYTYVCVIMFKIFLVKILTETLEIIVVILRFICISSVHIYIYICTHIYIHTHICIWDIFLFLLIQTESQKTLRIVGLPPWLLILFVEQCYPRLCIVRSCRFDCVKHRCCGVETSCAIFWGWWRCAHW